MKLPPPGGIRKSFEPAGSGISLLK